MKGTGRDEPIWVVRHTCMETTQGISLYTYLYFKVAKTPGFSYYLLCFFFNRIGEQEGRTGSAGARGVQIMYTYACKSDTC
jgi:hypothetical protein